MGEHLLSMYGWALGLIPNTAKQKMKQADIIMLLKKITALKGFILRSAHYSIFFEQSKLML